MRIKRDAKCYLSPLPDSLPGPSLLKTGLQMVLFFKNSQSPFFWIFPFFSRNKRPLFTQKIPAGKRLVTFMLNWKQKAINAKARKRKSLQYMPVSYCAAV